jgi:hypothetical protein
MNNVAKELYTTIKLNPEATEMHYTVSKYKVRDGMFKDFFCRVHHAHLTRSQRGLWI